MAEKDVFKWVVQNVAQFGAYQGGRAWEFDIADLCAMFLCFKDELAETERGEKGDSKEEVHG